MPDTPVDRPEPPPYYADHEARISRLEDDMHEVKTTLGQMLPVLVRIDSLLTATLPHLATKAELQELRTEFIGAQADTAAQFAEMRETYAAQFAGMRETYAAQFAGMREETAAQFAGMREETAAQFARAREETRAELSRIEQHTDARFDAVNAAIAELRTEVVVIRTDMAHVATKAELAEKPSKAYLWGVLAALIATYGIGLAGLAILR